MARQNKIVKYGIDKDVIRLRKKEDKSYSEIQEWIVNNYSDIEELKNISHMSIKRFIDSLNENEMEESLNEGTALKKIEKEFNGKMRSLLGDAEKLKKQTDEILSDAISKKASYGDLSKLIKTQNDNFNQIRKGLIALREYSDRQFIRPTQNIFIKQKNEINQIKVEYQNLLAELAHKLCPQCRKIIGEEISKIMKNHNIDEEDEIIDID